MSLVQTVLEKYGTPGGLTDKTDTSPSVSSVSESPRRIQCEKGTSGSSVSESGKGFSENYLDGSESQKPLGHSLTKLTQGSEAPPIIRGIRLDELQAEAGSDWPHISETPERLEAYAELVRTARMIRIGQVPPHWTAGTTCKHCGPVPIWPGCAPKVSGCPWCFNRVQGLSVPAFATSVQER